MPRKPGPWWRSATELPVLVATTGHGLGWHDSERGEWRPVTPDGRWLAPVLTPDEADALRRERDEARAEAITSASGLHDARMALAGIRRTVVDLDVMMPCPDVQTRMLADEIRRMVEAAATRIIDAPQVLSTLTRERDEARASLAAIKALLTTERP